MYSLGATAYECATGWRLPRSGPAREGRLRLPHCSEALQSVIGALLQPEPSARPSALVRINIVIRVVTYFVIHVFIQIFKALESLATRLCRRRGCFSNPPPHNVQGCGIV